MKSEAEIKETILRYKCELEGYQNEMFQLGLEGIEAYLESALEDDSQIVETTTDMLDLEIKVLQTQAIIAALEWVLDHKYAYDRRN